MTLKEEVAALRAEMVSQREDHRAEIETLRERIEELRRWRAWIAGGVVWVGTIFAFFATGIRKKFGLS